MSFKFSGSTGSWMYRNSGNPSSTNSFTLCFWAKRTANFSGIKALATLYPTDDSDGHGIYCNDSSYTAYSVSLQANYATAQAVADDPLALNTWTFIALVGSGGNISLKYWDGSDIVTETVGQTAFTPNKLRIGDGGANAHLFTGLIAHLRIFSAALNDAELEAEAASETVVRSTNRVSVHSGGGGSISAALTGELGTAFTNSGGVTYDADAPSFDSWSGITISGSSTLPAAQAIPEGSRVNRLLHSGDLSNSAWSKQGNEIIGGAATAPAEYGSAQRARIKTNTGGIYQMLSGIPEGQNTVSMVVRRVDADYVVFRFVASDFSKGAQGFFNLATGVWSSFSGFGGVSAPTVGVRNLSGGWYRIYIVATIAGSRGIEFYPTTSTQQVPAVDRSVDVAGFQFEDGNKATYYKPTTTAAVYRTLTSASGQLSIASIGVGQTATMTATFLDDAGKPWDQAGPVTFASSDETKATVAYTPGLLTDLSGRYTAVVTAVAQGTSDITASLGGVTSAGVEINVDSVSVTRRVRIRVRPGLEGTSGWNVGVYQVSSTSRFPQVYLFEALGQVFESAQVSDQSQMHVAVPTSVSLTEGQQVEVVIENDNVNGRAADGPGIFLAEVV